MARLRCHAANGGIVSGSISNGGMKHQRTRGIK